MCYENVFWILYGLKKNNISIIELLITYFKMLQVFTLFSSSVK